MTSKSRWALLAGAVIGGTVLRFSGIRAYSLWGDEFISLALSTGHSWYPFKGEETAPFHSADYYRDLVSLQPGYFSQQLIELLRINDQAPLYYVLLNLWLHLFETSEAAVRSLSLLASVGSIPLLYAIGRYLCSNLVGVYAAWVFALAPFQIAFALFNRPYALLGFFALLAALAVVHLARGERGWKWPTIYAVAVVLGVYTQYIFVWNLLFHVALIAFYQRQNRSALVRFAGACLAAGVICLLWAPTLLAQVRWSREVGSNSWFYWYSGVSTLADGAISLVRAILLLLAPGRIDGLCARLSLAPGCRIDSLATRAAYLIPLLIFAVCAWRFVHHIRTNSVEPRCAPNPWLVCAMWTACALAGPIMMDLLLDTHMVHSHRYFITASGPIYLAVAMGVIGIASTPVRRTIAVGLLAFLVGGSAAYLCGWSGTLMYQLGVREVAAHIDERTSERDLVLVLDPGLSPMDFAYYLRSNPDFARIDVPEHRRSSPDVATQLRALSTAHRPRSVWYLDDQGPERRTHEAVLEWLRAEYVEVEIRVFENVGLFQFAPRGNRE